MELKEKWVLCICIFGSSLFWLLQRLKNEYYFTQNYHVKYILPDGKAFKNPPAFTVQVTLKGKGWDLLAKSSKTLGQLIEVELLNENNQIVSSQTLIKNINNRIHSSNIQIYNVTPSFLDIHLIDQATKKIPILSRLGLEFKKGFYAYDKLQFVPDSVTITGSPQNIREIYSWPTKVIVLSGIDQNIRNQKILLEPPNNELIRLSNDQVNLNIEVEEFSEKKLNIPIIIKNTDLKVALLPNKASIKCVIGVSKYNLISPDDFEIYVNLDESRLDKNIHYAPLAISKMPSYVKSVKLEPITSNYFYLK